MQPAPLAAQLEEGQLREPREGPCISTSVGGTLTGRGGDLVIIDDPLKPIDAYSETKRGGVNSWYNNTLLSRLDNKQTGAIVIVMQRVHIDDLTASSLKIPMNGPSSTWRRSRKATKRPPCSAASFITARSATSCRRRASRCISSTI
jgi:hypothetical protein